MRFLSLDGKIFFHTLCNVTTDDNYLYRNGEMCATLIITLGACPSVTLSSWQKCMLNGNKERFKKKKKSPLSYFLKTFKDIEMKLDPNCAKQNSLSMPNLSVYKALLFLILGNIV